MIFKFFYIITTGLSYENDKVRRSLILLYGFSPLFFHQFKSLKENWRFFSRFLRSFSLFAYRVRYYVDPYWNRTIIERKTFVTIFTRWDNRRGNYFISFNVCLVMNLKELKIPIKDRTPMELRGITWRSLP